MKPLSILVERRLRSEKGLTLIELMIVLAILGMLITIVGVNVIGNLKEARNQTAQTQIKSFETALKLYNRDCGRYPSTAAGLGDLVQKPASCSRWKKYLDRETVPADPWGNAYEYYHPGVHGQEMEIISKGADGELNTADDIVSWSTEAGGLAGERKEGG